MRRNNQRQFRKGAASFYVVAFSTLILVIIAASFIAIIISEVTRSSNDDLSQSAYDSALAGVEDAKLAYYNYQSCLENGGSEDCQRIVAIMEGEPDCDMVGSILGRFPSGDTEKGEVFIQESNVGNNMQQAYTCVKIETSLTDYRATLSSENRTKIARVRFDNVNASSIKKVKVNWGVDLESNKYKFTNAKLDTQKVEFPRPSADESSLSVPPVITVGFVQTSQEFYIDDFNRVIRENGTGGNPDSFRTNRGTMFLVPTNDPGFASANVNNGGGGEGGDTAKRNYIGTCEGDCDEQEMDKGKHNVISASQIAKTNDKTVQNLPFAVYCPEDAGNEFICSATLELPEPIGGARNNDTFIFVVSLPYGKPMIDFSLEFFCDSNDDNCATESGSAGDEEGDEDSSGRVNLKGVQIQVDSTGRANDLVRRVETRMEGADDFSAFSTMGPLELTGDDGERDYLLDKNFLITSEYHSPEYYNDCFEKVFNNNGDTGCRNMPYMGK